MATYNLLSLVNQVLVNLRELPATDLSAPYSMLLASFINQAKEKVEAACNWRQLNTTLTFTTNLNQIQYTLLATGTPPVASNTGVFPSGSAEILTDEAGRHQVWDTTSAAASGVYRLSRLSREQEFAQNLYLATQPSIVQPNRFSYSYEGGNPTFTLVGNPAAGRVLTVRMKVPQGQLTLTTDILQVPHRPVVSWATFMACEERGEELSERSSLWKDRADAELDRAIGVQFSGEDDYLAFRNLDVGGGSGYTSGLY